MKQNINNTIQQLGLDYSAQSPVSLIISNRLAQIQKHAGGMNLLASIQRAKTGQFKYNLVVDTHVSNLVLTYGLKPVVEMYEAIYKLDNRKNSA